MSKDFNKPKGNIVRDDPVILTTLRIRSAISRTDGVPGGRKRRKSGERKSDFLGHSANGSSRPAMSLPKGLRVTMGEANPLNLPVVMLIVI